MGILSRGGLLSPKFSAPLVAKLCVEPPKILEAQARARSPLSPWQAWWGLGFTPLRSGQKR